MEKRTKIGGDFLGKRTFLGTIFLGKTHLFI